MKSMKVELTGTSPLIQHNIRLADPLDPITREIKKFTAKGSKMTDDERFIIRKLEWFGGLYMNTEKEVIDDGAIEVESGARVMMPSENLESMIVDAAKKSRKGPKAKAGVLVDNDVALAYAGPRDINKLYDAGAHAFVRAVRVQSARTIRTRPYFRQWSLEFEVTFDERLLSGSELQEWIETAGRIVGLGDWRPKYGRFEVSVD